MNRNNTGTLPAIGPFTPQVSRGAGKFRAIDCGRRVILVPEDVFPRLSFKDRPAEATAPRRVQSRVGMA